MIFSCGVSFQSKKKKIPDLSLPPCRFCDGSFREWVLMWLGHFVLGCYVMPASPLRPPQVSRYIVYLLMDCILDDLGRIRILPVPFLSCRPTKFLANNRTAARLLMNFWRFSSFKTTWINCKKICHIQMFLPKRSGPDTDPGSAILQLSYYGWPDAHKRCPYPYVRMVLCTDSFKDQTYLQ